MPSENKVAFPVASVAIGYVTVGRERLPVMIDREWMLPLSRLVDRTGGVVAPTTTEVAEQSAADMQQTIESMRSTIDGYRTVIADIIQRLEDLRIPQDLTSRVQTIEDRLQ